MIEQPLKFYPSTPHDCGYLAQQTAVSLFADPDAAMNTALYSLLIDHGFRRSGNHVYRPYCPDCQQCVPVRIPAQQFSPSRRLRRCWRANQDLEVSTSGQWREDYFALYRRYIQARHPGGSMDDPDPRRFQDFIASDWCETLFYEFRLEDRLVAVAVTDRVDQGLSAFYTYFDPELSRRRGLGNYAVLWQINQCQQLGLPWLYLGYWIADCDKMRYKQLYRPLQGLVHNRWRDLGHHQAMAHKHRKSHSHSIIDE